MSKEFQNWIKSKDDFIKKQAVNAASQLDLACEFKGYYIEDNDYYGSTEPFPLFKSFEHYQEDTPSTMFIDHIRYFFELNNESEKHTATVHFSEANQNGVLFSIEETVAEVNLNNNEVLEEHFNSLKKLMSKKFNLNK
ncbi:hypothetical protein [Pontimicrobium sp. MEBiC06410]